MVRNRGILTYVCVLVLVLSGAGATLESTDESAAPVVQSWSADQGSAEQIQPTAAP